jgi:hypothetical protein
MRERRIGSLLALAAALAACASPRLTNRPHESAAPCSVRPDGAAIVCGGSVFATVECKATPHGCERLALHYADGEVAELYAAAPGANVDAATQVSTAADGSRIWFLAVEGPSAARRWREYDVRRGKLWDMGDGQAESAAAGAGAVPLAIR